MRIGILETGRPAPELAENHGTYAEMVRTLLGAGDGVLQFVTYAVLEDHFPDSPGDCQGYVITGSRFSVTEETPWMLRLEALLREAVAAKIPVIGICFGHQILAKALGGKVTPAPTGWQLGLKEYDVSKRPAWMTDTPDVMRINAIHQDQVVEIPSGAEVIASAPGCPVAGLLYGDVAVSFQAHPEFTVAYEKDLLAANAGKSIPEDLAQRALNALLPPRDDIDASAIAHDLRDRKSVV